MSKDEIIAELPHLNPAELAEVQMKLDELAVGTKPISTMSYRTPSTDAGECLVDSIDDIETVLNKIQGPLHR